MSLTTSKTKAAALALVQALIAGTKKEFPAGNFRLGNVAFTTDSLVQELQSLVDTMMKRDAAEASAKDALKAVQDTAAKVDPVIRNYKRFLLAAFGENAQLLAEFGMQPLKARTPLSSDQRVAAAAKMRATRKARGTTSKKQKKVAQSWVAPRTPSPPTPQRTLH